MKLRFNKLVSGGLRVFWPPLLMFAFSLRGQAQGYVGDHECSETIIFDTQSLPWDGENLASWLQRELHWSGRNSLRALDTIVDISGAPHIRYAPCFDNILVEGHRLILHLDRNGVPLSVNGNLQAPFLRDTRTVVDQQTAFLIALGKFPEKARFSWSARDSELGAFCLQGDSTFQKVTSAEKCIVGVRLSSGFQWKLIYQWRILSVDPLMYKLIQVDAVTGEIVHVYELLYSDDVPAKGYTRYAGYQSFVCDSLDVNLYTLTERSRGADSFFVNNAKGTMPHKFFSSGVLWDLRNADQDEVAIDAMWGMEKTYDFFKEKFKRNSYDGKGHSIAATVHAGKGDAYWLANGRALLGDGDGLSTAPLTALDIVAHEITHGVTQETADLFYEKESGALNESFSDIFGKCVEYYALRDSFSWDLAHQIALGTTLSLRSFSDPNSRKHPKYYHGRYYDDTTNTDAYGVHTNSSVQNYWFYLLSEGGMGVREADGKAFRVRSIGMDTASAIAFYTLTTRLTPGSKFIDAANGSVAVAASLYGDSVAAQVINAWYAVGVLNTTDIHSSVSKLTSSINVYPNPTPQYCRVRSERDLKGCEIRVHNVLGVDHPVILTSVSPNEITMDLGGVGPGLYFLEITQTDGVRYLFKIIRE